VADKLARHMDGHHCCNNPDRSRSGSGPHCPPAAGGLTEIMNLDNEDK
jgi:hypothetical protein